MTPTTIELQPNHTAMVFDETGHMIEIYMPDHEDDALVPPKILAVLELVLNDR